MNKSSLRYKLINAPYILWSVLFILAPMFMVVYYAFTNRDGEFTFENITALSAYGATFGRSIWYAFWQPSFACCLPTRWHTLWRVPKRLSKEP